MIDPRLVNPEANGIMPGCNHRLCIAMRFIPHRKGQLPPGHSTGVLATLIAADALNAEGRMLLVGCNVIMSAASSATCVMMGVGTGRGLSDCASWKLPEERRPSIDAALESAFSAKVE
jgi:hypothetical protein